MAIEALRIRNRKASKLEVPCKEWDRQLRMYALAAASAGVSLLPTPAHAEVIYTPTNVTLTQGMLLIDLNADSIPDFVVADQFLPVPKSSFPVIGKRKLGLRGAVGAGAMASNHGAAVLESGVTIGSSRSFVDVHQTQILMLGGRSVYRGSTGTCCFSAYGNWMNVKRQYLGLKFTFNGETHYGWARFTVKLPTYVTSPIKATLSGFAYETNPGQAIKAGDTGVSDHESTNGCEPTTLGQLARGACEGRSVPPQNRIDPRRVKRLQSK